MSSYYETDTIEQLKKVKPTFWDALKTEGIDFESDFYWLDDYLFESERIELEKRFRLDRIIEVSLNHENELKRIETLLKGKNVHHRKYLFLDIDGVLNTIKYNCYAIDKGLPEVDEDGSVFDPEAIENLRYIITNTQADIVLTSTWRVDGLYKMRQLWKKRGLPGDVVGVIPQVLRIEMVYPYSTTFDSKVDLWQRRPTYGCRGIEIGEWLTHCFRKKEVPIGWLDSYSYAILDDENDFLLHQSEHVVLTNPYYGITKDVADKVIKVLNK